MDYLAIIFPTKLMRKIKAMLMLRRQDFNPKSLAV